MNKATQKAIGNIFFYLLIAVIGIYLIFPFYWALVSSLKTENELMRTPATWWPQNLTLANYRAIFSNQDFSLRELQRCLVYW